jgi:hypothetical protein
MMLVTQRAHPSSLDDHVRVVGYIFAYPARGEGAQDMTVRHDEHVAWPGRIALLTYSLCVKAIAQVGDETVQTGCDLSR